MKQNITSEQFDELTNTQLKKLYNITKSSYILRYAYKEEYDFEIQPYMRGQTLCSINIGNMIEWLQNNHTNYKNELIIDICQGTRVARENKICSIYTDFRSMEDGIVDYSNRNLCDILWSAVKSILGE